MESIQHPPGDGGGDRHETPPSDGGEEAIDLDALAAEIERLGGLDPAEAAEAGARIADTLGRALDREDL